MAYDGLMNFSVVNEIKDKIINGKVDKIFEPSYEEILLGIYSNGVKYALTFNINSKYYRANLTTHPKPNPNQAPNFCMTLRKYLLGTHITNIYTDNLERIIFIEFEGFNKSNDFSIKKLVIELMGKHSNIILLNNEDIIIDALKHFSLNSGSNRNIFAGEKYCAPKSDKLDFVEIKDKDEFYRVLVNNSKRLGSSSMQKILSSTFTGICKTSVQAFETWLDIENELSETSSHKLFEYIGKLLESTENVACVGFNDDYALKYISNYTTSKPNANNNSNAKDNNLQINFFIDDYYIEKENSTTFVNYRDSLLRFILNRLKKFNEKLDSINAKLQECKEAENYRLYGELITSNLYRIKEHNVEEITLENYYDNNSPITIALDKSISPSANAKKFFKKYQKLKSTKQYVDKQKVDIVANIDYLESIVYEINSAKTINELDNIYGELIETSVIKEKSSGKTVKKNSKNKNIGHLSLAKSGIGEPLKFEVDGFTVLVGKINRQNDYLTTKVANENDIWLHVKNFHGSHVILKTANKVPSQETINKCASLAKEHSKASQSSNVPVDYTFVKYVKKPSGSKPGMVIYTHEQTVIVK